MKAASNESYGYNEDEIVSSDIVGMRYGSLFDSTQTMVSKVDEDTYEVQVVSWYDNENSYTSQMVRTIKYFSELALFLIFIIRSKKGPADWAGPFLLEWQIILE